ncbi:hypothetical protein [Mycolicibacterium nivoides]|uniref:hypothetical protein n=1 Tax=Mycolicibacterium nivoides TaxID=2487344 RepID=UPI003C2F7F4C
MRRATHIDADRTPPPPSGHSMRMSGRGVIYSFSFDLGPDLDYIRLANRLLRNDMATVGGSPSRDGLRVGRRQFKTQRDHRKFQKRADFFNEIHSGNLALMRLWRADWFLCLRFGYLRKKLFLHAVFRILFGPPPPLPQQAQPSAQSAHPERRPEGMDDPLQVMTDAVDGIRDTFIQQLIWGGMRLRLEQQLYFPRYYEQIEPYIRLEMNRAYFTDGVFEHEPVEISLLIHRSGICMLTMATPVADELDFENAYEMLSSGTRAFGSFLLSAPIVGKKGRFIYAPEATYRREAEMREGLVWYSLSPPLRAGDEGNDEAETQSDLSLSTVYFYYLDVIEKAARRESRYEWRCFTTLFQGRPLCGCGPEEAKDNHGIEFGQLLIRSLHPDPVTDSVRNELLKNHLVNTHAELWLSAGSAIHTYWSRDDIDYVDDIHTIQPIEFAILQYAQLEAIDTRTINVDVKDRHLFKAQKQIATNIPEYGRNLVSDINAPRVVHALSELLNTAQVYSRVNDRVKVLESIVNTRFGRRQARRSLAISFIGFVIATLLLLPRIDEFVKKMALLTPTSGIVKSINDNFHTQDRAIVGIYIVAIIATFVIFLAFTFRVSLRRLRRRKRRFGYFTKHDVVVTRGPQLSSTDSENDSAAGQKYLV